jgi:hypothetical protein
MSTNPVNVSSVFSNGDSIAGFAKHHLMPTAVMNQFNWAKLSVIRDLWTDDCLT